jgi:hypothetical protein
VSSHALPEILARQSRRQRFRAELSRRKLVAGFTGPVTVLALAGEPGGHSTLSWVMDFLGHTAVLAVAAVAVTAAHLFAQRISATRLQPPSRWLYLLAALGYGGAAVSTAWLSHKSGGWAGDAAGVLFWWCAATAVALLGRAALRGPARRVFWLYQPAWLMSVTPYHTAPLRQSHVSPPVTSTGILTRRT